MYKARRTDAYFRGEVDKFIQAAENHTRIEKTQMIHCPCRTYKNMRVFNNTTIIGSHVLISSFVDNYMIRNKYGEEEQPQRENSLDEIMQDGVSSATAFRSAEQKIKISPGKSNLT